MRAAFQKGIYRGGTTGALVKVQRSIYALGGLQVQLKAQPRAYTLCRMLWLHSCSSPQTRQASGRMCVVVSCEASAILTRSLSLSNTRISGASMYQLSAFVLSLAPPRGKSTFASLCRICMARQLSIRKVLCLPPTYVHIMDFLFRLLLCFLTGSYVEAIVPLCLQGKLLQPLSGFSPGIPPLSSRHWGRLHT